MDEFIAPLGLKVDATQPAQAAVSLDKLTQAAGRAEGAANDLASSSKKLSDAEKAVANEAQRAMAGVSALAGEQEALTKTQQRLNSLHGTAIGNTKALNQATLNLGRQFADIGTQLAGGQSPFLILIQQGPQVADAFTVAAASGLSFKAVLTGVLAEAKALLITFGPWIAGLAAVGAAVWYVVDAQKKQEAAIDETTKRLEEQNKALGQISPLLSQAKMDADLAAEGQRNFDEWLRRTNVSLAEQIRLQRVKTLNDTNEAALKATEELQRAQAQFDRLNKPGAQMGFSTGVGAFSTVSAATGVNKESELYKKAAANLKKAREDVDAIQKRLAQQGQAPDVAFGKQSESANRAASSVRSVTKATQDYVRAAAVEESSLLRAANEVWPEAAAAAEAYKKQQDAIRAAANDNVRTFEQATAGQIRFSSTLEKVAMDLEDAAAMSRGLRYDIEDIAYAINSNDWTSAFAGLARVIMQVDAALKTAKTSQDRFNAAAMAVSAVGGAVGGTAGAGLSGAASGAMAGATIGSVIPGVGTVVGGVVGGIIGGLGGLFGSSKAKKQAKRQAEAQRAAEEAQRQQQIADTEFGLQVALLRAQGKETEAVAKEREKEIARLQALSPALVDLQKQLWETTDAAEKAAAIEARRSSIQDEIDKLTLSSADLLAKARAKERAEAVALDPTLGDLIDKLYGLQDATAAAADASKQAAEVADRLAQAQMAQAAQAQEALGEALGGLAAASERVNDALQETMRSLTDFADSLKAELGLSTTGGALDQARKAFNAAVSSGNYAAIPQLGQAYAEAAKSGAGSEAEYRRILAQIRLASLNSVTSAQSDAYQQQLSYSLMGAWFTGNDDLAMQIMRRQMAGLPGFASGGSFMIGGNPGVDQNLLSVNGVPAAMVGQGEIVSVKKGPANDNSYAEMVAELRALRAEVASLRRPVERMDRNLESVSEGGRAILTEAYEE